MTTKTNTPNQELRDYAASVCQKQSKFKQLEKELKMEKPVLHAMMEMAHLRKVSTDFGMCQIVSAPGSKVYSGIGEEIKNLIPELLMFGGALRLTTSTGEVKEYVLAGGDLIEEPGAETLRVSAI